MVVLTNEAHEELKSKLVSFVQIIAEEAHAMNSAAIDCIDNTGGDEAAKKASDALSECAAVINQQASVINQIISDMDREMDAVEKTRNRQIGGN